MNALNKSALVFISFILTFSKCWAIDLVLEVSGTVTEVNDTFNSLEGNVIVGEKVYGTIRYDPEAAGTGSNKSKTFVFTKASTTIMLKAGELEVSSGDGKSEIRAEVSNNLDSTGDAIRLTSKYNRNLLNGATVETIEWYLRDSSAQALSSASLPTTAIDPALFNVSDLVFSGQGIRNEADLFYNVRVKINHTRAVTQRQTSVSIASEQGDYVGSGRPGKFLPPQATFTFAQYYNNKIDINVLNPPYDWSFNFIAYNNKKLTQGIYLIEKFEPSSADFSMHISAEGNGTSNPTGYFTIKEFETDNSGKITSLWMTFESHSNYSESALTGEIRYNVLFSDQVFTPPSGDPIVSFDRIFELPRLEHALDVMRSQGGASILNLSQPIGFANGLGDSETMKVQDLNSDGLLDIIVLNTFGFDYPTSSTVQIFLQNSDRQFILHQRIKRIFGSAYETSSIDTGDFNGDGRIDIVVPSSRGVQILHQRINGFFGNPILVPCRYSKAAVAKGDFNNDGLDDVISGDVSAGFIEVILQNKTLDFFSQNYLKLSKTIPVSYYNGIKLIAADMNGDKLDDLVIESTSQSLGVDSASFSIYHQKPNGSLIREYSDSLPLDYNTNYGLVNNIAVGDINSDGRKDLVLTDLHPRPYVTIFKNLGSLGYSSGIRYSIPRSGAPAMMDVDRDGLTDILVLSDNNLLFLKQNQNGTFSQALRLASFTADNSSYTELFVVDADRDGLLDAVGLQKGIAVWWGRNGFDNKPLSSAPAVVLRRPLDNMFMVKDSSFIINVETEDVENDIDRVEYFVNENKIYESVSVPYHANIKLPNIGHYVIKAKAVDKAGNTSITDGLSIRVQDGVRTSNLSTRLNVGRGDDVLIGGFIITGVGSRPVMIRGIGPSLLASGITNSLKDPTLEIYDSSGNLLASNNDWNSDPAQAKLVRQTGLQPTSENEASVVLELGEGAYTAILRGVEEEQGNAMVEIYELDSEISSRLVNISTRGRVRSGDNVMIGGVIIQGSKPQKVIIRAIGPTLRNSGLSDALDDPVLEIYDSQNQLIAVNNDWKSSQRTEIEASGIPPQHDRESAIVATLSPGAYTAIVRSNSSKDGVALVEMYELN